jgi:hypothetical protein
MAAARVSIAARFIEPVEYFITKLIEGTLAGRCVVQAQRELLDGSRRTPTGARAPFRLGGPCEEGFPIPPSEVVPTCGSAKPNAGGQRVVSRRAALNQPHHQHDHRDD